MTAQIAPPSCRSRCPRPTDVDLLLKPCSQGQVIRTHAEVDKTPLTGLTGKELSWAASGKPTSRQMWKAIRGKGSYAWPDCFFLTSTRSVFQTHGSWWFFIWIWYDLMSSQALSVPSSPDNKSPLAASRLCAVSDWWFSDLPRFAASRIRSSARAALGPKSCVIRCWGWQGHQDTTCRF